MKKFLTGILIGISLWSLLFGMTKVPCKCSVVARYYYHGKLVDKDLPAPGHSVWGEVRNSTCKIHHIYITYDSASYDSK